MRDRARSAAGGRKPAGLAARRQLHTLMAQQPSAVSCPPKPARSVTGLVAADAPPTWSGPDHDMPATNILPADSGRLLTVVIPSRAFAQIIRLRACCIAPIPGAEAPEWPRRGRTASRRPSVAAATQEGPTCDGRVVGAACGYGAAAAWRGWAVPLLRPAVMVRAWDKPLRLVTCMASRLR